MNRARAIASPEGMIAWSKRLGLHEQHTERLRYNDLPQHTADQFGWPGLVANVARAWERIPEADRPHAAIFGQNYGASGAVDFFGPAHGLPPALGRHNEHWRWSRARIEQGPPIEVAVVIGDREPRLREIFAQVERVATQSDPLAMPYEGDLPIWLCRSPKVSLPRLWQEARLYQ